VIGFPAVNLPLAGDYAPYAIPGPFLFGRFRDESKGCKSMVSRRIEFFVRTC